jgi:hypothetical protein
MTSHQSQDGSNLLGPAPMVIRTVSAMANAKPIAVLAKAKARFPERCMEMINEVNP